MKEQDKKLLDAVRECGVVLPENSDYYYALHTCYKCNKPMVVFDWNSSELWDKKDPPKPIPKTVQKRYTKTTESTYWVNVCPFCDSVQGDWYLNMEPGGVFSGIPDYDEFGYQPPEKNDVKAPREEIPEQKSLL